MHIDQITEHLYASAIFFQEDVDTIVKQGITAVVNLALNETYELPPGIAYLHAGVRDNWAIPYKILDRIYSFIGKHITDGRVLVHCNAGVSRSGGILIGELLIENPDWDWPDAESYVRQKHFILVAPRTKQGIIDFLFKKMGKVRDYRPFQ